MLSWFLNRFADFFPPDDKQSNTWTLYNGFLVVYVQKIIGDSDSALHSHPWRWGLVIPLVPLTEELKMGDSVVVRRLFRLRPRVLRFSTYHRVVSKHTPYWIVVAASSSGCPRKYWDKGTKIEFSSEEYSRVLAALGVYNATTTVKIHA